jgi:hypothetical protein
LIAAAPELLTALIHCHDWILSQQTSDKEGEAVRLEAKAIIAKATGRQIIPQYDPLTVEV